MSQSSLLCHLAIKKNEKHTSYISNKPPADQMAFKHFRLKNKLFKPLEFAVHYNDYFSNTYGILDFDFQSSHFDSAHIIGKWTLGKPRYQQKTDLALLLHELISQSPCLKHLCPSVRGRLLAAEEQLPHSTQRRKA